MIRDGFLKLRGLLHTMKKQCEETTTIVRIPLDKKRGPEVIDFASLQKFCSFLTKGLIVCAIVLFFKNSR